MKYFTAGITGDRFGFKLFVPHETRYYYAFHRNSGAKFMWLETKRLGRAICYPYLIKTADETVGFLRDVDPNAKVNNTYLVNRWKETINADNLEAEFDYRRLEESEFIDLFDLIVDSSPDELPPQKKRLTD